VKDRPRILVVDDEDVVRLSYLATLARSDCRALAAPDGEEALRAMERDPCDVVLLDLRLPGTDGLGVLKALKEKWPDSEVVMITGYPSVDSAKEAVRLGAFDYLAKPVGPEEILGAVDGAINQRRWALRPVLERSHP
jgi:DNA-binding NtrC family response regulator